MSSPSDPGDDDGPISAVSINGPIELLSPLSSDPRIDLVRGSTTDEDDQTRTVVAYVTQAAFSDLQNPNSGLTVTPLADSGTLQERWDTVYGQQVE